MRKFYSLIVKNPKKIIAFFLILAVAGAILQNLVAVNYDMTDYLPEDSKSTISLDTMEEEFDGGIPNARVMVKDVSIPEALDYKEELEACDGVTDVTWLDDAVSIYEPLELADTDEVETYYKDNAALFTVTIDEKKQIETVDEIRAIIGDDNAMTGNAVSTALATTSTVSEIRLIAIFAVIVVLIVLLLTTSSWLEPVIILLGLGVAIMINSGSNLIFGEISFVTNAAGSILQLAVSLDYSVFLIHQYEDSLKAISDNDEAMVDALCKATSSILSSGLTTVIGFLALVFMRFRIGPDLGLALAKGVAISLITVFIFMPALILKLYPTMERLSHRSLVPKFTGFAKVVSRMMVPMACVFAIVMVPAFLASNQNSYYYGSSHIFGMDTQYGQDTAKIEEVFGQSDTYVVLVPRGDRKTERALSDELHEIPEVTSIISYVDTVGAEIPEQYLDEDILSQLESEHYSRMVLSLDIPYEGDETFALVENIRDTADEYYPDESYLAGEGVSTYDLMDTITADTLKVNLIAILAVFVVLLLTMKSVTLPVILVLSIETAIWLNMATPYFNDSVLFYIAYLIVSSIQLGATVDYAILFTNNYMEYRKSMGRKQAIRETVSSVTVSLLTSGTVLAVVGFLLSGFSSHGILAQLGFLLGKGTVFSVIIVFFVLPGLLYIFDGLIRRTTKHTDFYMHKDAKGN